MASSPLIRAPSKTPRASETQDVPQDVREKWQDGTVASLSLLPVAAVSPDSPVRTALAASRAHRGQCVLVVENEQCIHQLPELPDTIAILGAGLDLQWLGSPHLAGKSLGYWGDMDTWGLLMLARARQRQPAIKALLMARSIFDRYESTSAVAEPVKAQDAAPDGLQPCEADFYRYLLRRERGRLEQEYLPKDLVENAIATWTM